MAKQPQQKPKQTRPPRAPKADNNTAVIKMTAARSRYSRPVINRRFPLYSFQAQNVAEKLLDRVAYSLFSSEVILQILAEREQVDELESIIADDVANSHDNLDREFARLRELMKDADIQEQDTPSYTRPVQVEVEISSPLVARYIALIQKLDRLMGMIDCLWMNGVLDNKQRMNATYQWQRHVNKLSGRIINIENRARKAAKSSGRDSEVDQEAPRKAEHAGADTSIASEGEESEESDSDASPAEPLAVTPKTATG
nr:hypothetical protein [uncultured Halomonas sp.]